MTVVELLVVIGVLALLMALTVPSLRGVRTSARLGAEQSAARQLMAGYIAYANANRDMVLPGYLPQGTAGAVVDDGGQPILLDQPKRRYPWRLAPYLSFRVDVLFANEHQEVLKQLRAMTHDDYIYGVSLSPSLGLNTEWVGGDANAHAFKPPDHPLATLFDFNRFYITRLTQARHADRLLVFASARGIDPAQSAAAGKSGGFVPVEGHHQVTSPFLTSVQGPRWDDAFVPAAMPSTFGYVSPRFSNRSVVAFIGGHVGALSQEDMRDMRYWANWADEHDWALPLLNP